MSPIISVRQAIGKGVEKIMTWSKSLHHKPFSLYSHRKILSAEHIVFGFAECILSRFDVFANDLWNKFKSCLRLLEGKWPW